MSGLMRKDRDTFLEALSNEGFRPIKEDYEGDWWGVASKRKDDS